MKLNQHGPTVCVLVAEKPYLLDDVESTLPHGEFGLIELESKYLIIDEPDYLNHRAGPVGCSLQTQIVV
jgi:hypothetical protein